MNSIKLFLGSSLALPANGLGGSRATSFLVAHFALQNTASNPAKKNRALPEKQAGKKEGGWGEGIFARLRFPRRRRGWGGGVSAIARRNGAEAGGNAGRDSVQIRKRIFLKKSSDFVQSPEPNCMLWVVCLGASRLGKQIV
ncbi:MAG: hypothetical protein CEN87_600 [Parcubacteria group bacterium Licking1014_1]|nr:MAG: hypothetical protein CEN87_600 [Parcubacteria group bacterium Licking1014_1]